MLWFISLALCVLLSASPAYADTSGPPAATRGEYVPAPTVRVPELRQRALSEAQKVITDARLRLQVSGGPPADPTRVVVVEQKPEPNTLVRAGTTVTVVVQAPTARRTAPRDVIVPERVTVVPDLLKHPLSEAQPLVANAKLKLEVSGGAPEDTRRAVVTDQKPSPGTRVLVGSTVVVIVRTPPSEEFAVVPDLQPQRLREAQRRIREARLRLEVAGGWPPDPTQAIVVDQKPAKGTRVPLNSVVMVAVRILPTPQPESPTVPRVPPTAPPYVTPPYTPPPTASPPTAPPPRDEWVLVPGLRQRPLMGALQLVRNEQLRLDVTGGWPSDPAHAVVVDQTPAPGTRVRIGTTVTVQVLPAGQALQPPPTAPQPPPAHATPAQPSPAQATPPQSPPAQATLPQSPPAHTPPPRPPPAQAPPPRAELVTVPELREHFLGDARELTSSSRLELHARGVRPEDERRTVVVNQSPAAGTRVAARSIVRVELGPALLVIPDLRTHPLDEARQILSKAGFDLAIMGAPPANESRATVVEQAPLPGVRAAAGSIVTVRAKTSQLWTWVIAGAATLLAAGAAAGIARWRGVRSHPSAGLPGVRVVANGDVGQQELRSNGTASNGFAIRLRSRIDAGSQVVDTDAAIVAQERRADG
jgi:beta-lactam-binding protein with PASTA domain